MAPVRGYYGQTQREFDGRNMRPRASLRKGYVRWSHVIAPLLCATELSAARSSTRLGEGLRTHFPAGERVRTQEIAMFIGTWVVAGVIAGFLASKFVVRTGDGLLRDVGLGIAGAVVGGLVFGPLRRPIRAG